MVSQHIAPYSTSSKVGFAEVQRIAAAVNKQLLRDYYPIWGRPTQIIACSTPMQIPLGYWSAQIMDDVGEPGALGFHSDTHNQPFAKIDVNDDTSVTVSHEVLKMATDPFGNRLITATLRGHGVRVLCEVCNPNEAETYEIDGVKVSNFYTPEWFDTLATKATKYDFLGKLSTPLTLRPGGYMSYIKNSHWFQDTWFNTSLPSTRQLDMTRRPDQSLRSMVDEYMRANNWEATV